MPLVEVCRLAPAFAYALSVERAGRVLSGCKGFLGYQLTKFFSLITFYLTIK